MIERSGVAGMVLNEPVSPMLRCYPPMPKGTRSEQVVTFLHPMPVTCMNNQKDIILLTLVN